MALSILVAVVSGVVLAAVAAGNRTAAAYPRFLAAHSFDGTLYNNKPVPQLAHLPEVASAIEGPIAFNGVPHCACTHPIDGNNLSIISLSPTALRRVVSLVAGRFPDDSKPDEVLASFNLEQDNGVHVGSVIRVPFYSPSQAQIAYNTPPGQGPAPAGPTVDFHVVGIEAAEIEFPSGSSPSYDIYTTDAFARTVEPATTTGFTYFVTLRHGNADGPRFKADLKALGVQQSGNLDTPAVLVANSIHPQAEGWWILALLAALAGLAVVGQALSRQRAVEAEDYPTLRALGIGSTGLLQLGMVTTLIIGATGALGGLLIAFALSPIAPVGEARFAETSAGFAFDAVTLLVGAIVTLVVVGLLGLWPAVRATARAEHRPARPSAVASALAQAGAPPTALIGIRQALERGRGATGVPATTALLGTILAVTALVGTAIFSTSLTALTTTPHLYGDDYQAIVYAQQPGKDSLITKLERSPLIADITIGTALPFEAGGVHFTVFATQPVRGDTLLSVVTGRLPGAPEDIALGVTTMHALGAHVGSLIRLTPQVVGALSRHSTTFRVVGTVALPTGVAAAQTGMGTGGAITLTGALAAVCPTGHQQPTCIRAAKQKLQVAAFVTAAPGHRAEVAIRRLINDYPLVVETPSPPTGLVNFGQAVNFPLIFGLLLSLFGVATLIHLLVVSVYRRRHEMGLLKTLGFLNRQVGATVFWQATTLAVIGLVVGIPIGLVVGGIAWRTFATNLGVVPLAVVDGALIVAIAVGVFVVASLLSVGPAVIAARSRPGQLLRVQ
ncbi:MAG TPA: FtsX-like permease family protein [Acidimicrobiales bacterium]|nr:FtsX-like permease family protein [Acidimicrobiales bacterium]